jgi:large subunit ribosomal protein L25
MHIDFLRVRMDQAIQTTVVVDLHGADSAPGVVEGGILNQELREVNVEALPGDIPDSIVFDASGLEMNATLTLASITAPSGVTLLDDPESVVATITPPTAEPVEEEIETETELVGEAGAAEDEAGEAEGGDEASAADAGGDS